MPKKALTLKELFDIALPGAREVRTAGKQLAGPIGDFAGQMMKDPLGTMFGALNPLQGYGATLEATKKAKEQPNLENFMNLVGTGMMTQPTMGAVQYTHGHKGLPVMRDPHTGVQFAPPSTYYFGKTEQAQQEMLGKIRRMLESSEMQPEMFTEGVLDKFGTQLPGQRTSVGVTESIMNEWSKYPGFLHMGQNLADAAERIPINAPINTYIDPFLELRGAAGEFVPNTARPYIKILPDRNTVAGAFPHELQHWQDYSGNTKLWSAGAGDFMDMGYMIDTPTASVNRFVAESRAELAAERFKHWLRTNGVMHWWSEPGSWPD